jgi:hypothetical protein
MYPSIGRGILDRGARSNVWRNTLSQMPSVFGRLVYLSSLRDPNTGRYQHAGIASMFGEDGADQALRVHHSQTFAEWLCYDLEQQKADLDLYLSAIVDKRQRVVATWSKIAPYRALIPTSASEWEVALYLADFDALFQLLKNAYGAVEQD